MNEDLLLLADTTTNHEGEEPPPTDMFYTRAALQRSSALDAMRLGVSIGIAWMVLFLLIIPGALMSGGNASLLVVQAFYPGFTAGAGGILFGLALSFVYGTIGGIAIGSLYNSLVQREVLAGENYETYG